MSIGRAIRNPSRSRLPAQGLPSSECKSYGDVGARTSFSPEDRFTCTASKGFGRWEGSGARSRCCCCALPSSMSPVAPPPPRRRSASLMSSRRPGRLRDKLLRRRRRFPNSGSGLATTSIGTSSSIAARHCGGTRATSASSSSILVTSTSTRSRSTRMTAPASARCHFPRRCSVMGRAVFATKCPTRISASQVSGSRIHCTGAPSGTTWSSSPAPAISAPWRRTRCSDSPRADWRSTPGCRPARSSRRSRSSGWSGPRGTRQA